MLFDWIDFNIENITDEQINYIRAELNLEEEQRVRNISRFTYSIYYWLRMLI